MLFSQKTPDTLEEKKKSLAAYIETFNTAVSVLTNTIDALGGLSTNINDSIREIEEYQANLELTKAGLTEAKEKNDRVIQNFKALLALD